MSNFEVVVSFAQVVQLVVQKYHKIYIDLYPSDKLDTDL